MAYQGQQQGDREFLSVTGFVETKKGKKPVDCGYAFRDGDKVRVVVKSIPVGQWDGSLTIEARQPRGQGGGSYQGGQQRAAAPAKADDDVPY